MDGAVSDARRAAAMIAVVAIVALVAATLAFSARNLASLALAAVGVALVVGGGWWVVSERGGRRVVGGIVVALGAIAVVIAVVRSAVDADRPWLRLAAVAVLAAVAMWCAHAALRPDAGSLSSIGRVRGGPPSRPVLLCNPWSGGGKVERFGLVAMAEELGVETVLLDRGLDLEQLARDAVARGADCLGMAGGDGSQALVASIAIEHDLPFVCVSAGTRNHFALDLGLDREDPRRSMYAFRDAVERRVDFATVGDRLFVNNVSLGVYATIVQQEGYRDAKVDTTKSQLPELLGRTAQPFDLQFTTPDGEEVDGAFLIMVSNNPYVLGTSLDVSQRRRLDTGRLGVFAVNTRTGAEAAKLVMLSAVGQRNRSPFWHEFTTESFEIRSRSAMALAGVDGEALTLDTPLTFRSHPGGLRLLTPADNPAVVADRRSRDVHLGDLVAVLKGRDPL